MPVATCPRPDELLAFVVGQTPDEEARLIAEHLDECTACEQTATSIEKRPDAFIARLKQPLGDESYLREAEFVNVAEAVAAWEREPSSLDGERRAINIDAEQIGQYRLLEKLGQGGMGAVYKALHVRLEKIVALKILPRERIENAAAVKRFDREMKAVGRLNHPHIVRAMDAGEADGWHFLVMEYVEGVDLSRLMRSRGPLPIDAACEIVRQAALGLQHAYEHGLVHRDIKPSNLMLEVPPASGERRLWETDIDSTGKGAGAGGSIPSASIPSASIPSASIQKADASRSPVVKILDLGLALLGEGHEPFETDLTGAGQMMGTLDYMAPEQGDDSHEVDIRADIYSLGATLYKLLAGEAIYHGPNCQSPLQKMRALAGEPAPPIQSRRADVPDELAAIVHRMIAKDPRLRFQTPAEVAAALGPWAGRRCLARLLDTSSGAIGWGQAMAPERPTASGAIGSVIFPDVDVAPKSGGKPRSPARYAAIGGAIALAVLAVVLAALFVFRTPQGTITVQIDEKYRDDVTLQVTGEGKTVQLSAAGGWKIKLGDGEYKIDLGDSSDRFVLDKNSVTVRRGEHQVVRVSRKPPPKTVPAMQPQPDLGRQAIEWLTAHSAPQVRTNLVADARPKILAETGRGRGFVYSFSGSLMQSGQPTVMAVFGSKLFTREVSREQGSLMGLMGRSIAEMPGGFPIRGRRALRPEFQLTALRLDNEDELGKNGAIIGRVDYQRLREGDASTRKYWLRMSIVFDDGIQDNYQGLSGDLAAQQGGLQLYIDSLPTPPKPRARPIFIEVGAYRGDSRDDADFVALSDPLLAVVTLHPAEKATDP